MRQQNKCVFIMVALYLFILLIFGITAQHPMHQTEFDEKSELSEFVPLLNNQVRNITYEFHPLNDGDVKFFLFTRKKPSAVELNETNLCLINPKMDTTFIIGGWLQNFRADQMYQNMIKAFLIKGEFNVIIVDYHNKIMFFPLAVTMTYILPSGIAVGQFIINLNKYYGIPLSTIHIVAHSLGGNVAGFAGKEVTKITGSKLRRITGLDVSQFPLDSLNKSDAEIVDVIHTSALVGISQPIGTIDFYPNSDDYTLQPGCTLYPTGSLRNRADIIEFLFCSHHKSYEYFIKTINSTFKAVKCKSFEKFRDGRCRGNEVAIFGENYVPGPEGQFYLYLNCSNVDCYTSY